MSYTQSIARTSSINASFAPPHYVIRRGQTYAGWRTGQIVTGLAFARNFCVRSEAEQLANNLNSASKGWQVEPLDLLALERAA